MKIAFEKIVPAGGSSFKMLHKSAPAFDGRFHFHPEFEITLIQSGTGRRVVGDNIHPFAPGDLVLLGENLPHQYLSHPQPGRDRSVAKVLQFGRRILSDEFLQLPELAPITKMLKRAQRGLNFTGHTLAQAQSIIKALFEAAGIDRLILLMRLLDVLSRDRRAIPIASAGYLPDISSREGNLTDKALAFFNENFREAVTMTDLAHHLHVSPATCNRLLKKTIGRSFKTSLVEIRISHACRLLLETNQSIVSIAYASGFTNLSNFNRHFKQLKNLTPRAYRNLARDSGQTD